MESKKVILPNEFWEKGSWESQNQSQNQSLTTQCHKLDLIKTYVIRLLHPIFKNIITIVSKIIKTVKMQHSLNVDVTLIV